MNDRPDDPAREMPLVSVVTATYNMARYLPETIASVLEQDYPALEHIIVDDGSTDDTAAVLARWRDDPRVRVIRQANAGQTAAKNRGIAEARGELIAFLDADDTWLPGKLRKQVPHFADPEVGVVFGNMIYVDGEGHPLSLPHMKAYGGWITDKLLIDNFVAFPTVVVRRSVLEELGGFDESLSMSIDYELWLRISVHYRFVHVDEPLARYRIWEGQMSHRKAERFDNFFRMLERFLAQHPGIVSGAAIRHGYAHSYASRAWWHLQEGRRGDALRDLARALRHRPWDVRSWRIALRTFLKR